MRILLVYPAHDHPVDGIRDYAIRLIEELRAEGDDAALLRPRRGLTLGPSLLGALPRRGETALVLQYNPFAWGRWGMAPSLVLALALVRLLRPQIRVLLTIHEAYVPVRDIRTLAMGGWQRGQLRALLALAHGAVVAAGWLAPVLSRGWPYRPVGHLPASSNLPDERRSRCTERALNGYEGRFVIATFTTGHESHLHSHVAYAASAVARACTRPVLLLLLGSNNVAPSDIPEVEQTVTPGYLDAPALARALSTADLFLAPFAEGATTRRTSLMAAMQHGVAIVTTASEFTDRCLTDGEALAFSAADDCSGFASQAARLAADAPVRAKRAVAGRALYERHFSWPVVCAGLRAAIVAASKPSS